MTWRRPSRWGNSTILVREGPVGWDEMTNQMQGKPHAVHRPGRRQKTSFPYFADVIDDYLCQEKLTACPDDTLPPVFIDEPAEEGAGGSEAAADEEGAAVMRDPMARDEL